MPRPLLPGILLSSAAAALSGCSIGGVHGVDITNKTDRIVRVELLQLRKTGEMTVYSTQTLGISGDFKHKVDSEERRPGMRVRLTLDDQAVGDGNWILLNLPADRDRAYDLNLIGNRLSARETAKARKAKVTD